MRRKYLAILVIPIIFSGCAATPEATIGLPARPNLIPISQFQWETISPDVQDTIQHNDLALKAWGRKLEGRITLHDESR
jgi:hypothetical protein